MGGRVRYTEEFKLGAVVKRYGDVPDKTESSGEQGEIKRLKAELRRVTEERDILKKATAFFVNDHR